MAMGCKFTIFGGVPPRHTCCFGFKLNDDCSARFGCAFEYRHVVVIGEERAVMSLENREESFFVHAVLVGIVDGEVGDEVHG